MCVHDSGEELCLAPLGEEDFSEDHGQLIVDEDGEPPFVRSFRLDHWWGKLILVEEVVVRAATSTTKEAVASTTLVDEADEIIKGSTTVETSKGNVIHVVWKTIIPLHAISSSNYANPSRTLALTPTREIKRKPNSKEGIHVHKKETICVHSRMLGSLRIRIYQRINSWMWSIMTTKYIIPSSLTRRRSDGVMTDHGPLRLQPHTPLQMQPPLHLTMAKRIRHVIPHHHWHPQSGTSEIFWITRATKNIVATLMWIFISRLHLVRLISDTSPWTQPHHHHHQNHHPPFDTHVHTMSMQMNGIMKRVYRLE